MTVSSKIALVNAGQVLAIALAAFAVFGPILFAGCATTPAPVSKAGCGSWLASAVQADASVHLAVTLSDPACGPYSFGYLPTSAGAILGIKRLDVDGGTAVARGPAGLYKVHAVSEACGCAIANVSIPVTTPVPHALLFSGDVRQDDSENSHDRRGYTIDPSEKAGFPFRRFILAYAGVLIWALCSYLDGRLRRRSGWLDWLGLGCLAGGLFWLCLSLWPGSWGWWL